MLPKYHALIGFVFAFSLVFFSNISLTAGIIIFLSSILIDIDHYFRYFIKTKNLNPIKFWNWSLEKTRAWCKIKKQDRENYQKPIFIFHGIEFFLLIFILSLYSKLFFLILLGISLHFVLDFIYMAYYKIPFYEKLSPIYVFIRNNDKKAFRIITSKLSI